jgi:5-methylcytosine-specific restriction enzyme A
MIKLLKHAYNLLRSSARDVGISTKRSSHWPKVEKDFLSKNPTCAICSSSNRLNVHHKKPFHLHPELELDETNLITLCMSDKECHLMIGHGDDFKAYNPNIEADAKKLHKDISKFATVEAEAKSNRVYQ